jgi:hypothetical protein
MIRSLTLLVILLGGAANVQADVFKCTRLNGSVSFAAVPCGPEVGATSWESTTVRTKLKSISPEDAKPQVINERATEILRTGYNTRIKYTVTVTSDPNGEKLKYDGKQGFNYNTCNRGGQVVACSGNGP